jgi:hypothetical protein
MDGQKKKVMTCATAGRVWAGYGTELIQGLRFGETHAIALWRSVKDAAKDMAYVSPAGSPSYCGHWITGYS